MALLPAALVLVRPSGDPGVTCRMLESFSELFLGAAIGGAGWWAVSGGVICQQETMALHVRKNENKKSGGSERKRVTCSKKLWSNRLLQAAFPTLLNHFFIVHGFGEA